MDEFTRFAVYYAPGPGPFAAWTAAWLGWDPATGVEVPHPDVPGLPMPAADLTAAPRKYGFHGTLKPPFRLAPGKTPDALHAACTALARGLGPVILPGLRLALLDGFLALVPEGDQTRLGALAARVVAGLDAFRAPPRDEEITRRNPDRLTPRQRDYLGRWGYPYVMDEFRFHLTLTGALPPGTADATAAALVPVLARLLPRPFILGDLCLFAEGHDGRFRIQHRYTLSA